MTPSTSDHPVGYHQDPRLAPVAHDHATAFGGPCVRLVAAPDGALFEGVSFACPRIAALREEGSEEIVTVHEAEIDSLPVDAVETPVRIDSKWAISWETCLLVEATLDEILAREDEQPGRCLVAGHVWLGILLRLLREMPGGRPERCTDSASTASVDDAVRFYVDRTRAEGFARAFGVALRPAAQGALKRMALTAFTTVREAVQMRRRFQLPLAPRILVRNALAWAGRGGIRPPGSEGVLGWDRLRTHREALRSESSQALLRLWLRHALFRKDLVRRTDVFAGYGYLVLAWGLVEAAAVTRAEAGETDPTPGALAAVESLCLRHPDLDQSLLYHPALALQMDRLMRRPNFAHSMVDG